MNPKGKSIQIGNANVVKVNFKGVWMRFDEINNAFEF